MVDGDGDVDIGTYTCPLNLRQKPATNASFAIVLIGGAVPAPVALRQDAAQA
jgi:hypothetical protein